MESRVGSGDVMWASLAIHHIFDPVGSDLRRSYDPPVYTWVNEKMRIEKFFRRIYLKYRRYADNVRLV